MCPWSIVKVKQRADETETGKRGGFGGNVDRVTPEGQETG